MPGVAIQPNNPSGHSGKYTPTLGRDPYQMPLTAAQNGSNRFHHELSAAEIKTKAKEGVNKEARGVSAITLIKTARTQIISAREYEIRGDLRAAYASYIKAATLAKMTMDSPEYVQETKTRGGVIRKELNDFLEVCAQAPMCSNYSCCAA